MRRRPRRLSGAGTPASRRSRRGAGSRPGSTSTRTRAGDAGCIEGARRGLGATPEAVRFFQASHHFLGDFTAVDRVDVGRASSPWVDVGREEAVFLTGAPSAVRASAAFEGRRDRWQGAPGYTELLRREPNAFPWVEYGGPTPASTLPDGGQRLVLPVVMPACRACPDVALMPVAFHVDARGVLAGTDGWPPAPVEVLPAPAAGPPAPVPFRGVGAPFEPL